MNGILVPRFYNTNIVYDDIPANSILTLDTNSYSSITLQDGILAKSNNAVGFTKPTGLLYGSMNNDVWTLNSIDPPTTSENAADKTLYYSNGKYVWSELSVSSKNIQVDPPNLNGKWTNLLINESNNFTSTPASVNNYGIFDSRGYVVNFDNRIINDLGFKFFSPADINEVGYVTTNLIIFNSSSELVEFPVNYYNIINFHSISATKDIKISSDIQNLSYTKGLYNYTENQNNIPLNLNDTFPTTQQGFYAYVTGNNATDMYIHYTTTIDVNSIYMPLPPSENNNYYRRNYIKDQNIYENEYYTLDKISKYKIIVGVFTNFSDIKLRTTYANIFLCNQNTPVVSSDNINTLLGYLIIDLKDIDLTTGKVNINKAYTVDSTVPFNQDNRYLTTEQLKNGIISFRPFYYIDNLNNIKSLYYNDYIDKPFIQSIKSITEDKINFIDGHVLDKDNKQYEYVNDKLRLTGDMCVDSNFQNIYTGSQLVMPYYAFTNVTVDKAGNNITITTNNTYCDYKNKNIYFLGDNYIKAFNYYIADNITAKTNNMIGYFAYNNNLVHTCLRTYDNHLQNRTIILQSGTYKLSDNTIALETGTETKILQLIEGTNAYYWSNDAIVIEDPHNMFNLSGINLIYNNKNDFVIPYGTYEIINTRIDKSLTYITPEDNNVHVYYKCTGGDIYYSDFSYHAANGNITYFISINEICLMRGIVTLKNFNRMSYVGIYNGNELQGIYEKHPFLFNGNYIINNELLVDNSEKKFKTTVWGITYTDDNDNTTTVFKNTEVKWNLLNQFVLDSTKYYYNATNKSIYTKDSNILVVENVNGVSYHEYVEILNSNYYCMHNICNANNKYISILCHELYPLSTYNLSYANNYISIVNYTNYKGTNNYDPNDPLVLPDTWYNLFTTSAYDTITSNNNITTSIKDGVITLNLNDLNNTENPRLIVGQQGIYNNNTFFIHYDGNVTDNIVYTTEYTDFPFFDVPIEKDMKVLLNPITKYSNLKYYQTSKTTETYTLATYVDFKVSLCNINATLTSYIGEYPSIIN